MSTTKFIEEQGYMIGITSRGDKFMFDKDKYEIVKQYSWHTNRDGYICTNVLQENKKYKTVRLSRMILPPEQSDLKVDHINHNIKDNRISNLRITTNSQNCMNRKVRSDNKLGIKGVRKKGSKYEARICANGKTYNLGYFQTCEEAVTAYENAATILHGEYKYKK